MSQPEVGPYLKNYTTDFQTCFSYIILGHWRLALGNRDPMLTFTSGSTGSATYLKNYTTDFQTFCSYRFLGHWRLALVNRDPMLTFTYGSTGSETISQELHNWFSKLFQLQTPWALEFSLRVTVTPCWPLLLGQPEVGPYLKNYTTDFQTFFSYRLLGHCISTFG